MSFGRLLAAGKSWVGGDGIGRYRMQKHIRLPKFISPHNPFKAQPAAETLGLPAVMPAATGLADGAAAPANVFSWWVRVRAGLRRFTGFCRDHNPFGQKSRVERRAIPRFRGSGEQGELSLEKLEVLRGDLAHADLEVVPVGLGGNQAANPAWRNLTTRIFGAGMK